MNSNNKCTSASFSDLNIYPQPANSTVSLQWNYTNEEEVEIKLLDVPGNVVLSFHKTKSTAPILLNVGKLPQGIYILELKTNGETFYKKIVKQ